MNRTENQRNKVIFGALTPVGFLLLFVALVPMLGYQVALEGIAALGGSLALTHAALSPGLRTSNWVIFLAGSGVLCAAGVSADLIIHGHFSIDGGFNVFGFGLSIVSIYFRLRKSTKPE